MGHNKEKESVRKKIQRLNDGGQRRRGGIRKRVDNREVCIAWSKGMQSNVSVKHESLTESSLCYPVAELHTNQIKALD